MKIFLLFICIVGAIIKPIYAQALKPQELLQNINEFDQKSVCVTAEVLEVMLLDDGAWINIGDQGNSLGLWLNKNISIPDIQFKASYKSVGDQVEACGIFHKSFKEKHGELLVDVDSIKISKTGHVIVHEVSKKKKEVLNKVAIGLLIIIILFVIKRFVDGRRSKKNKRASVS